MLYKLTWYLVPIFLGIIVVSSIPFRQSLPANPTKAVDGNSSLGNVALEFGFWTGAVIPLGLGICRFVTAAFYAKPLSNCPS